MKETIEQLTEQAKEAYQKSDFKSAIHFFKEAENTYEASGDITMAAEMANNRSVVLLQAGDAKAALEACKNTHLVFAQARDSRREGLAYGNQAAALRELGQRSESLKMYQASAEKLALAGDRENLSIVQKSISALEIESGKTLSSMSSMLDALRTKEKLTFREKLLRKLFSLAARFVR